MYDSPKAAHFAAFDHAGRELRYDSQRGLDARWLAAKYAEAAGVDFTRLLRVDDLATLMEACAAASVASGLRVKVAADELRRLREIAGEYTGELQPAGVGDAH